MLIKEVRYFNITSKWKITDKPGDIGNFSYNKKRLESVHWSASIKLGPV